jgi:hypothetical protein
MFHTRKYLSQSSSQGKKKAFSFRGHGTGTVNNRVISHSPGLSAVCMNHCLAEVCFPPSVLH